MRLSNLLKEAEREVLERRPQAEVPGVYVRFEAPPGVDLKLDSLESVRSGIRLLAVTKSAVPNQPEIERATVFIPAGKVNHFLTRFQQYATEDTKTGHPKHQDLVDRIASIQLATLRGFWTDTTDRFPTEDQSIWWEVWLRRDDGGEVGRFIEFAQQAGVEVGARRLAFDDRVVCLAYASPAQLASSIDVLGDLAEVRAAKAAAAFFVHDLTNVEQAQWAGDLLQRMQGPHGDAPAVCVLDTGVTQGHPLIAPLLDPADAGAADPGWGPHDSGGGNGNVGHGTQMAGLAAYGDLAPALSSNQPVRVSHRLESVKILPPVGANRPDLYGTITALAVSRPEIQAVERRRVFLMAVTAPDAGERGQPTSWSAAVDSLAAGRSFDQHEQGLTYLDAGHHGTQRLFVLSAGNVAPNQLALPYLDVCDTSCVQDPAQAWNAVTVGGFTEKAVIPHPGWLPLAEPGNLSPWSSTSLNFDEQWPNKPDVVCEGGNVGHDGAANFDPDIPDLNLVSTHHQPLIRHFTLSNATSAAAAQVARMAARVTADYPDYWPETVRGLIVHSARWTEPMLAVLGAAGGKRAIGRTVLRRYGMGVPDVSRALRSANDALTLVAHAAIHPYQRTKMREMHLHRLPWPTEQLEALHDQVVRLRVTLSYFIEPNAGRLGWKKRHSYASHALRFEVKTAEETDDAFRKRLNKRALAEEEARPTGVVNSGDWLLGYQNRNRGSIHSDIWEGTAAELASRGVIGIYPVSGWWKEQLARDRSDVGARYALIVSIETDAEGVDIWTPVAQQVEIQIDVTPQ